MLSLKKRNKKKIGGFISFYKFMYFFFFFLNLVGWFMWKMDFQFPQCMLTKTEIKRKCCKLYLHLIPQAPTTTERK